MSKRYAWLLGMMVLVSVGLLVACGTAYHSGFDGLVLVSSQGSALLETFSFSLNSGSISAVNNPPSDTGIFTTCLQNGLPSAIVVNPAGTYAYTIITANQSVCGSKSTANGILAFKINSDGTVTAVGSLAEDPNPVALLMDSTGKFLFVAEGLNSIPSAPNVATPGPCPGTTQQFGICEYSVSGATLTPVPGTFNFMLPPGANFQTPNFAAIGVTPMVLPQLVNGEQQGACSASLSNRPTAEYLYAVDSVNAVVWEYSVNTSTGALGNPPNKSQVAYFSTGPAQSVPSGVAVDACDRFVYVSNTLTNNISAYTICTGMPTQSASNCPATPDGSLVAVAGSPFSLTGSASGPGPIMTDPFGKFLYVLDTLSNQVSPFGISPVSGSLTAHGPVGTGSQPTSFAIRSDDSWLFVANFNSATISQFSITPLSGALTPLTVTSTDNYPWGVAVK